MANKPTSDGEKGKRRRPPATTLEGRENQLVSLAVELAEKQMREGTASSQVITHYLKLGTTREKLEQERLRLENEHTKAKTEALASVERIESLYADAIKHMTSYQPTQGAIPADVVAFDE